MSVSPFETLGVCPLVPSLHRLRALFGDQHGSEKLERSVTCQFHLSLVIYELFLRSASGKNRQAGGGGTGGGAGGFGGLGGSGFCRIFDSLVSYLTNSITFAEGTLRRDRGARRRRCGNIIDDEQQRDRPKSLQPYGLRRDGLCFFVASPRR